MTVFHWVLSSDPGLLGHCLVGSCFRALDLLASLSVAPMYCSPHRLQLTCMETPYDTTPYDTIKRSQFISNYFGQFEVFVHFRSTFMIYSLLSINQEHSRTFEEAQTCGYQLNLSSGIGRPEIGPTRYF